VQAAEPTSATTTQRNNVLVDFYPVLNNQSIPDCRSAAPPVECTYCYNSSNCNRFSGTAAAAGEGYVPVCLDSRCIFLLLGPVLAPNFLTVSNESDSVSIGDGNPFYTAAAESANSTIRRAAMVLARVRLPSALQIRVTWYRAAAVCSPGSAGGGEGPGAPGILAGPRLGAVFRGQNHTVIALDEMLESVPANSSLPTPNQLVFPMSSSCRPCTPGSVAKDFATGACAACPAGSRQPARAATACILCTTGSYQPASNSTECIQCDLSTPTSLTAGSVQAGSCFGATVGIESAWFLGKSLAVRIFWSLYPLTAADVSDMVALFKETPGSPPYLRRQLAWSYTSVPAIPQDYYGGGAPGDAPVAVGSLTLKVPSAGEGLYSVRFFHNSSGLNIPGRLEVSTGGAVLASATYFAAVGVPVPKPPAGFAAMPFTAAVNSFPDDVGSQVADGGLVCPAGTVTMYLSELSTGGGYENRQIIVVADSHL
jgi:hypothetical protein